VAAGGGGRGSWLTEPVAVFSAQTLIDTMHSPPDLASLGHAPLRGRDLAHWPRPSFSDAEIPKNHIKDILDVHSTQKLAERPGREPQMLGHNLVAA
jgi:hypothetical protein